MFDSLRTPRVSTRKSGFCALALVLMFVGDAAAASGGNQGGGNQGGGNQGGGGKGKNGKLGQNPAGGVGGAGGTKPKVTPGQAPAKPASPTAPPNFPGPPAPELPPGVTPREDKQDARALFEREKLQDPDLIVDEGLQWGVRLDSSARDRVATDTTRVFAITSAGTAYALAGETGDPLWTARVGQAATARPALAAERLVLALASGDLVSLDAITGAQRASIRSPGPVVGAIVSNGTSVAFSTSDGACYVVDPKLLKIETIYRGVPGVGLTPPTFAGDCVLVADTRGKVISFGRTDGRPKWERTVVGRIETAPIVLSLPVYLVVVGTTSGLVQAFDLTTGTDRWRSIQIGAFLGACAQGPDLLLAFSQTRAPVIATTTGAVKREMLFAHVPCSNPITRSGETFVAQNGGRLDDYDDLGRLRRTIELRSTTTSLVGGSSGDGIAVIATDDAGLYRIRDR